MAIIHLTNEQFINRVADYKSNPDSFNFLGDKPALIDFYAEWCGPCRRQMPIVDNFKSKMGDEVNVIKVDIDQEQELAKRYRIQSVPTIIFFKNGEAVWRASGIQSHTDLMVALNGIEWREGECYMKHNTSAWAATTRKNIVRGYTVE